MFGAGNGPYNNALQLTSGGSMRASRASSMRRLQLSAVLGGRRGRNRESHREVLAVR
jgi:hypothetical protein